MKCIRATSSVVIVLVAIVLAGCKSGTAGKIISVQVTPTGINLVVSTTQQFKAVVTDTDDQLVTWTVVGGSANGTVSSTGLYTAPATVPSPALVTVMAVADKDKTKSGSAQVTVTATSQPSNVTVSISPVAPNVNAFSTQLFTAQVSGTANTAVTWQVNGITGGSQNLGFVSSGGLYVAPGRVPTTTDGSGGSITTTFTVTAVSQADPTASASAIVNVIPANQNAQTGAIELGSSGSNVKDTNVSAGSIACCGGTLGSLVTRGGTQYILGNTHVLARSDAAAAGEAIVQPGLIDTNCDSTQAVTVANLTSFANLENEGHGAAASNVDAAIAQVVSGKVDTSGNILYLGDTADSNGVPLPGAPHAGSGVPASINLDVAKSGRSTGLTCSAVIATNVSVSVQYTKNCDGTGTPFTVEYLNQVDVTGGDFSAEGDSGSLIVSQNTADPVALLYAGSDSDTVGNPVGPVLGFFASGGNNAAFVGGSTHTVVGCSLPNAPQSASLKLQANTASADAVQKAITARTAHVSELLARPEVQAIGVGPSFDNPTEAAMVFFVTKGMPRAAIPTQIDGVRTRVVEGDLFPRRGAISLADSAINEQSTAAPRASYSISAAEYERAKGVHATYADEWMKKAGVQGVGITSSADAPGEAALMIFVIRGAQHPAIPAVIDGLRTRVRESSRIRAGRWGNEQRKACRVPAAKTKAALTLSR
jgi:hypothetical protein